MLTIAIPTFNRNHLLKATVERVLTQMEAPERLLIIDNCSDVPVRNTLGTWLDEIGAEQVQIVRNPVNVGGGANILHCLELCETRWLYCLGDDDLVADNCLATIRQTLLAQADALYISFNRPEVGRTQTFRAEGMADFVDKLDSWSSFLFMSCSVVNAQKLRTQLRFGYLYAYSWAPLQAILFKMLNDGGCVVFSHQFLCSEESLSDETWAPFPVAAGKMVLPELVDDAQLRKRLARKLMAQPTLLSLIYWARVKGPAPGVDSRFLVGLYIHRCAGYIGWGRLLPFHILAFFVLRPRLLPTWLFNAIQALAFRMLRRPIPAARPMSHDRA